jgi:uncharacterized protein (DUF1697 family)
MNIYIVLLRGINVGGRNTLPMKELVALLEELGCQNIKTYIQSGNVAMQSAKKNTEGLSDRITLEIKKRRGFEPRVLMLEIEAFEQAAATNPFPEAESDPKTLHVGFLASAPANPDLEGLESFKKENERFRLDGKLFYLHAPDGIGRSKLAEKAERLIGVPMTLRNLRTVGKILAMAQELA